MHNYFCHLEELLCTPHISNLISPSVQPSWKQASSSVFVMGHNNGHCSLTGRGHGIFLPHRWVLLLPCHLIFPVYNPHCRTLLLRSCVCFGSHRGSKSSRKPKAPPASIVPLRSMDYNTVPWSGIWLNSWPPAEVVGRVGPCRHNAKVPKLPYQGLSASKER